MAGGSFYGTFDAAGDHGAPACVNARVQELYRRHWSELCRYVNATFGVGPPDPEDVAQTAFTKFMALDDPHVVANPRAFLYATARNIVLDFNRHYKLTRSHATRTVQASEDGCVDEISPERIVIARERAQTLAAAIRGLPRQQRQPLILNRLHGLSYSEIAQRVGSSKSDVKRQIERAMAAIEAAVDAVD
ncbi:MAG: RNA polymerase sigma factor [Steroidobacter sp.]